MGRNIEQIVLMRSDIDRPEFDATQKVRNVEQFSLERCQCFYSEDKEMMLGIIEAAFGDLEITE